WACRDVLPRLGLLCSDDPFMRRGQPGIGYAVCRERLGLLRLGKLGLGLRVSVSALLELCLRDQVGARLFLVSLPLLGRKGKALTRSIQLSLRAIQIQLERLDIEFGQDLPCQHPITYPHSAADNLAVHPK